MAFGPDGLACRAGRRRGGEVRDLRSATHEQYGFHHRRTVLSRHWQAGRVFDEKGMVRLSAGPLLSRPRRRPDRSQSQHLHDGADGRRVRPPRPFPSGHHARRHTQTRGRMEAGLLLHRAQGWRTHPAGIHRLRAEGGRHHGDFPPYRRRRNRHPIHPLALRGHDR